MKKSRFVSLVPVMAGPTLWDQQGRLGGDTDLALTPEAIARIHLLATTLRGKLAAICTGPEQACTEAGALLASGTKLKPRKIPGLKDPGIGLWQGMLESELERRYPSCFESWRADPATVSIPSGEEWADASSRLVTSLLKESDRLADGEARHLAVVLRPLAWSELVRLLTKRATSDIPTILGSGEEAPVLLDIERARDLVEDGGFRAASLVPRPFQRLLGT